MVLTRFAHVAFLAIAFLGGLQAANAQGSTRDIDSVSATVLSFHSALLAGNAEAAAKFLASDAVVLEGGEVESRSEYVAHHLLEDIKFAKAVPTKRGPTSVTISGDVAWATNSSVTRGKYKSKPVHLVGAELMVLSRSPAGWQIRAIHWSSRKAK